MKFKAGDYIKLKSGRSKSYNEVLVVLGLSSRDAGHGPQYKLNTIASASKYPFEYHASWIDLTYDLMSVEEVVIMKLEGKI